MPKDKKTSAQSFDADCADVSQALRESVRRLESRFIRDIDGADDWFFDNVTKDAAELTSSEYAVLFEVFDHDDGRSLLRAVSAFPDGDFSALYRDAAELSDLFYNRDSFFNEVMVTGQTVIANHPESDERGGEYAAGHPAVRSFIGVPFYFGGKMLGLLALMNRVGGYDEPVVEFLAPLSNACGFILFAIRNNQRRMLAETMLEDSVSSISAIVDTVVDGIMTINEYGIVESFNPAAERIFGYVAKEVIGRNVSVLMPGHYRNEHDSYLTNYLTTGERKVIGIGREVEGRRRDGSVFPLELSVSEMEAGNKRMFTGIVRDITERKQSEESLRDNMARIGAIVDTVVDGIVMIDDDGKIESFNPAAERIFGYQNDEVEGRNVSMLMPEPYHDEHDDYLDHYKGTGEKRVIGIGREVEGRRKDGSTFPLELSVSEMWLGEQRKFAGVVRDVTERKQSEDKLRDSAARIEAIVDTVVDGIITINERGLIETINPAAESIFGYFADSVVGRNVSMLMPEPYHEEHDSYLESYQRTGVRKVIGIGREVVGLRKDGSTFPLELSVSEMWLGGRRMFTGVVRDITERKNIDTMKNEFISTVSHELRTPLTSIRGSLGLVAGGAMGELPEKALKMVEIAEKNSERLISLINDILDIEKIAAGKMEFDLKVQPLLPIIASAIESNAAYGEQYGVCYRMGEFKDDVCVNVDAGRLQQVLSNYMSNAAKFSPRGSEVKVDMEFDGDHIRILVSDCGEGIPAPFQARIFQKFSQADSGNSRKKQGTGLGLAISKEIIEQMAGSVGFTSEEGKGSIFYCRLPECGGQADFEPLSSPVQRKKKGSLNKVVPELGHLYSVLHVEDDVDLHHVVAEVCHDVATFDCATTLQAAIAKLSGAQHYDLVLLDFELPDGLGWDLMPLINGLDNSPPVIVLAANDLSHEKQEQVAGVLLKSRTSNEALLKSICEVLNIPA